MSLETLATGEYRLVARKAGFQDLTRTALIEKGKVTTVELSLVAGKNKKVRPASTAPARTGFLSRVRWVPVGVDLALVGGTVALGVFAQRENATSVDNYEIYQNLTYMDDPELYYEDMVASHRRNARWLAAGACTTGALTVASVLLWPVLTPTGEGVGLGVGWRW